MLTYDQLVLIRIASKSVMIDVANRTTGVTYPWAERIL